jgi:hypothetical protein
MPIHGTAHIVERDARGVAGPLGWLSIALGLAGLLAPRRRARTVGAPTTRPAVIALRVVGLRALVQRYRKPLLDRIEQGQIDPSFVITHRLPLAEAARGYEMFLRKHDDCVKIVLTP